MIHAPLPQLGGELIDSKILSYSGTLLHAT